EPRVVDVVVDVVELMVVDVVVVPIVVVVVGRVVGVTVVVVVATVVVVAAGSVVVVVVGHGRFAGRGFYTRMWVVGSTAGVELRPNAAPRSGGRRGWSGPNAPRWASTAMDTKSPHADFVRSSPSLSVANRGG